MIGVFSYTVILTYLSLISSSIGIMLCAYGNPTGAIIMLLVSGLCDMFDGKVARLKKRSDYEKSFGVQIDSLSDLVAFGVLPASIGYAIGLTEYFWCILFTIYILFALVRLAHFNVITECATSKNTKLTYFTGLPVTSAALIFPLLYLFRYKLGSTFPYFYAGILLIVALLFISKIKVRKPGWKTLIVFLIAGTAIGVIHIIESLS